MATLAAGAESLALDAVRTYVRALLDRGLCTCRRRYLVEEDTSYHFTTYSWQDITQRGQYARHFDYAGAPGQLM